MSEPATLHFAADLPALAALLDQHLAAWRTKDRGPFAPVYVVTAHRAMREWLKQELAALRGGVANLKFLSPGAVLARCGRSGGTVFGAVHRELGDGTPHAPARQYIDHDGPDESRRELRRYTLASRLSAQFQTYASHAFIPAGDDWRSQLYAKAAPALELAAPEEPLDGPLFVFDLPVPGFDFIDATARLGVQRHVFLRASPEATEGSLWLRHGRQLQLARQRWEARGAKVDTKAEPPAVKLPDVTLFEAPSLRRACEVAAAQLWSWARDESASPRVRFHEMAIVVPSGLREKLLPTLREVLEEAHELPKVVWNVPLGPNNRVATLAQQLLELPSTGLRRAEVLSVLTHPLVSGAFGEDLPEAWAEWLDSVGIFHGLDASSHEGTYLAGKHVAHWDQGLTRLALGAFLGAERSGEVAPLAVGHRTIEPEELSQSSLPSLGLLLRFVRSLLGDANAIKKARLSASEWKELLVAYLDAYLRPTEDGDRRIKGSVLRQLNAFDDLGLDGPFGWEVARTVALGAVGGAAGSMGIHFGVGVVIGTPEDLAGLSFRRLVLLGLEEGTFPSKSRLSELDQRIDDEGLAKEAVRPDDGRLIDSRNFFDLVQAATGQVCLVPIAHDPLTAERREPSSLVKDLLFELKQAGENVAAVDVPLHRREDAADAKSAAVWAFPETAVEHALFERGKELTSGARPLPPITAFSPEWQAFFGRRPMPPQRPGEEAVIEVWLSTLVKFLEHPAQAWAQHRLNFQKDDAGEDEAVDEPFVHSALSSSSLFSETLTELLTQVSRAQLAQDAKGPLQAAYEKVRARQLSNGTLAVGHFGALQVEKDLKALEVMLAQCLELPEFQPPYHQLRWGPSSYGSSGARPLAPIERKGLVVRGVPVTVRLTGSSHLVSQAHDHLFRFRQTLHVPAQFKVGGLRKQGLQAFVEHLLLSVTEAPRQRVAMAAGRNREPLAWTLPPMPQAQAAATLDLLLSDLLNERVAFKFPTVGVLQEWESLAAPDQDWDRQKKALERLSRRVLDEGGAETESREVVTRVNELRGPTEAEFTRALRRLTPWMESRAADEGARTPKKEPASPPAAAAPKRTRKKSAEAEGSAAAAPAKKRGGKKS